ncbi:MULTISPECIES: DUF7315 family membrane protein [Halorussus]|uniref:DUF7315 family membrane protein n=1 Tax=Halorussus TaxID=1070314 RepID=UPI00209DCB0F|nr:hypothetical protein [Halorussus vallis]USZ75825.1 hypothetical protein NGM07_00535 [Halorussus vallis]
MDSSTDRSDDESRAREVVVPLHLYKVVTVFSTLFAVAFVVGGFIVLDTATGQARLSFSEVDVPVAILGVAMVAAGAVVYAFSTRFRAEGMGKPKDGSDEPSDNG